MAPRAQLTPGAPIELRSKIRNRFYEPILLDSALAADNEALQQRQAADASADTAGNQEKLFHDFLNKISQVCDSKKCGGDTVTSFVVLAHLDNAPQPIEYRFACNQRTAAQLRNTTNFVARLLETIGSDQGGGAGSAVLRQILQFNKSRVKVYLASLEKQCGPCIRSLGDALAQQDPMRLLRDRVHALEETLANVKLLLDQDDEHYILACNQAYLVIHDIVKPEMANLTMVMAREGHMAQRPFWCELRHAAARFISYYRAVGTFQQVRRLWPELFADFTVNPIASSSPWTNGFKRAQGASAHDIIGRMTSDRQKIAEYRAQAAQLEAVDLNERIRLNAGRIKPIVHAEVLVLQSLVDDNIVGDINKFFHRYQYIGSSKPTCRLCWYYFETHDSDVKVRSSHWNLYPNWRVPDMYNEEDVARMEGIMNKMSDRIRGDVFRSLSQRVSLRRPHDSNSDRTYPTFLLVNTAQTPDNLLSAFGNLQIQDQNLPYSQAVAAGMPPGNSTFPSSSDSSPESRGDEPTILEDLDFTFVSNGEEEVDNDDDDDDTGGASLV